MNIENGNLFIKFNDHNGTQCALSIEYHVLEFQVNLDSEISPISAALTQEDVKALLPCLQAYAETGRLEAKQKGQ